MEPLTAPFPGWCCSKIEADANIYSTSDAVHPSKPEEGDRQAVVDPKHVRTMPRTCKQHYKTSIYNVY